MLKTWTAAIAATLLLCATPARAAQTATPEMFGALPTVDEAVISPDGRTIAALHNFGDTTGIVMYDVETGAPTGDGFRIGKVKARDLQWADDDNLLLLSSISRKLAGTELREIFRWLVYSAKRKKLTPLFGNEDVYYIPEPGSMLATLPDEPGKVLFVRWTASAKSYSMGSNQTGYSLFTVELPRGRTLLAEGGTNKTFKWIVDEDGKALARVEYNDYLQQDRIFTRPEGSSTFELLTERNSPRFDDSELTLLSRSTRPGKLLASTQAFRDKRSIIEFDLATGANGDVIFSHPRYDISRIGYDPHEARVRTVYYTDDLPQSFHLDKEDQELQEKLTRALEGAAPMVLSRSRDGGKMIVRVAYTDHPDQFFLFDRDGMRLKLLFEANQPLAGSIYAKKIKFDYVATDGLTIPGYLTLPVNSAESNLPFIVMPHGGPAARDDQSFDWWAFFYAARGYAVYQPNFRGSSGYGRNFRKAGEGEWGRKMQDDITEGVRKLIAEGFADPDRICIVGASYGGYAALAGATQTPDLYRCAVSVAGVADLSLLLREARESSARRRQFWELRIGARLRSPESLDEVSPVRLASRAKAPILMIHGKDDSVVEINQSRSMARALKNYGKEHELVELPGEDHWLSSAETRIEMLKRSIEFIDRHIGSDASGAPAAR